jgi:hypothetical protein
MTPLEHPPRTLSEIHADGHPVDPDASMEDHFPPARTINDGLNLRAQKIAAIHALAHFYADNPCVAMPAHVMAFSHTYPHQGDEMARVNDVLYLASATGETATETGDQINARHQIAWIGGMAVTVSATADLTPQAPVKRYT